MHGEFGAGAGDARNSGAYYAQASPVDRRDMLGDDVYEGDIMPGAGQVCADRAADGARAPNE